MIVAATTTDIDAILPLLALRHRELGGGAFDATAARAKLSELTHPKGAGSVGIIPDNGTVVASVGLTVARFWDSADLHLEDLWTFVHPDHRKSKHHKNLITFAKAVSNRMGLKLLMAQPENDETMPQVNVLLTGAFARVGGLFEHNPAAPAEPAVQGLEGLVAEQKNRCFICYRLFEPRSTFKAPELFCIDGRQAPWKEPSAPHRYAAACRECASEIRAKRFPDNARRLRRYGYA